jgi:hypothetical protein
MMLHTTVGVDAANQTLANLTRSMQIVNEKLDMIAVFRAFDTPLEKTLQNYVTERGGVDACIADDGALKHLTALTHKKDGPLHPSLANDAKKNPRTVVVASDAKKPPENPLKALKEELMEDVEESLAKNMLIFERKLEVQQRQIVKDVEDVVKRSGDLVIKTIISGPHDRIIDPVRRASCILFTISFKLNNLNLLGFAYHLERNGMSLRILPNFGHRFRLLSRVGKGASKLDISSWLFRIISSKSRWMDQAMRWECMLKLPYSWTLGSLVPLEMLTLWSLRRLLLWMINGRWNIYLSQGSSRF